MKHALKVLPLFKILNCMKEPCYSWKGKGTIEIVFVINVNSSTFGGGGIILEKGMALFCKFSKLKVIFFSCKILNLLSKNKSWTLGNSHFKDYVSLEMGKV